MPDSKCMKRFLNKSKLKPLICGSFLFKGINMLEQDHAGLSLHVLVQGQGTLKLGIFN